MTTLLMKAVRSTLACAALAMTTFAAAQDADGSWQSSKIGLGAAKTPVLQPWTMPAEFGKVRGSDTSNYDTVDFAVEWSRQLAQKDYFHRFSAAPYWQYSERENKPVNDRGVTLAYALKPRSDGVQGPNVVETNWMASLVAGRTKTEIGATKTYTDASQTTLKLSALLKSNGWSTAYLYPIVSAGLFLDRRDKPTQVVPNGREDGLFVRPELVLYPMTISKKGELWSPEITAIAQYQHDLRADGLRVKDNHRWFRLQLAVPFGSIGEGDDKWQLALALQRSGGEDATQAEPRKYQTKIALQLKYGK